jgi:hypothetical protein
MSITERDLSRRDVLRGALAGAVLGAVPVSACTHPQPGSPQHAAVAAKKRILILGGTGFLGPKTVAVAVARGHEVTIFNRGRREKLLPLEIKVEHLYGNRDPDLPADDERGADGSEQDRRAFPERCDGRVPCEHREERQRRHAVARRVPEDRHGRDDPQSPQCP